MVPVGPGAAVDAHHYAGVTYDYFLRKHNRRGYDGRDAAIISVAHVSRNLNNASWNGRNMAYGDGDGTNFRPLSAALDVVAHELMHAVTTSTSNLRYQDQSGALNESVSDIFGSIVEHEVQPDEKKNWLCGEDASLRGAAFRDLAHPTPGQPDHMSRYVNTTQDNGGVHINSGIPNNAFYLMTAGGANDTSKVAVARGLGWDKAAQVWYRAEVNYFMQNTNLVQGAQGTLSAARDLNFTDEEQNIVECAWISVGVLPGQCKPISAVAPGTPPGADAGTGEEPGTDPTEPGSGEGGGENGLGADDSDEFEPPLLRRRKVGSFCATSGAGHPPEPGRGSRSWRRSPRGGARRRRRTEESRAVGRVAAWTDAFDVAAASLRGRMPRRRRANPVGARGRAIRRVLEQPDLPVRSCREAAGHLRVRRVGHVDVVAVICVVPGPSSNIILRQGRPCSPPARASSGTRSASARDNGRSSRARARSARRGSRRRPCTRRARLHGDGRRDARPVAVGLLEAELARVRRIRGRRRGSASAWASAFRRARRRASRSRRPSRRGSTRKPPRACSRSRWCSRRIDR